MENCHCGDGESITFLGLPPSAKVLIRQSAAKEAANLFNGGQNSKLPTDIGTKRANFDKNAESTLFSQQWLVVAMDEAHQARNMNPAYWFMLRLAAQSKHRVVATATPIQTRPSVRVRALIKLAFTSHDCHFRTFGRSAAS